MREGWKNLPKVQMVHIPEDIKVPDTIPASEVIIPSTYANGRVEYEDDEGNQTDEGNATHIRFTGKDRRSDIVVGPVKPEGMIKLNLYLNDDSIPVNKENASHTKSRILNEEYKPVKYKNEV